MSESAPPNLMAISYQKLVSELALADQAIDDGCHPLAGSIQALHAVNEFIASDDRVANAGLSKALRRLLAALHDRANGGKPEMLFSGRIEDHDKLGRPTNKSFDYLRGVIVAALDELIDSKIGNREAAKKIARMLHEKGIKNREKSIPASMLLQWREQLNDSGPAAANEMHRAARAESAALKKGAPLISAEQVAKAMISKVALWNSN